MTNRQIMQALLAGEQPDVTPQWIMGISNHELVEKLMPRELLYEGYEMYPAKGAYPFAAMGEKRLAAEQRFLRRLDDVAFPVGWGAAAAFGHCGPGEFAGRVIEDDGNRAVLLYETGNKKKVHRRPHFVHMFGMPVQSAADLDKLELPDPADPARYAGLADDIAWAKARGEWTIAYVNGFFSSVHYFLRDYGEFFMDLAAEPDFAHAMVDRLGGWTLTAAERICQAGVDCIGFCDDLGSEHAMLISPEMYKEFIWPWHRRLCEMVHGHGAVVHMHSHGAIQPALPLIREAGVDILNPLDPDDSMPMEAVRRAIGGRMVLCGGMNKHFFDWPADRQADFLRGLVAEGRRLGPHIVMDSAGIPDNCTREGFDRFLAISREIRVEKPKK